MLNEDIVVKTKFMRLAHYKLFASAVHDCYKIYITMLRLVARQSGLDCSIIGIIGSTALNTKANRG